MALPTTISSVDLRSGYKRIKPILHGSNVYVVFCTTDFLAVSVQKATDPTSSFSEVGNWDQTSSQTISTMSAEAVGDNIYIWLTKSSNDVMRRVFDMSTDSWAAAETDSGQNGESHGASGSGLAIRSDGDEVYSYRDASQRIMGTNYSRVSYTRKESTSYTEVAIDDGGEAAYPDPVSCIDDGDRTYFFYQDSADDHIYKKDLSSGNTLGSAAQVSDNIATAIADDEPNFSAVVTTPVFYLSGSTKRVVAAWRRDSDSKIYTSKIDDNGTPDAEEVATASAAKGLPVIADMAVDGTKVYMLYVRSSDEDLYVLENDDDGGWTGETSVVTSTDIDYVGCAVYTRSGSKVLAYVYKDAGTWKYGEHSLAAAPATAIQDAIGLGVVPFSR